MEAFIQRLSSPAVAFPIFLLVIYSVYNRLTAVPNIPTGLPWTGKDSSKWFANTRANLGSFTRCREYLEAGYKQVPLLV